MRQETGSNNSKVQKAVSIQLRLGGHSFSASELEGVASEGTINLVVESDRVTLVPQAEFDASHAKHYLEVCGKRPAKSECVVCSEAQNDIVAVMAVDSCAYDLTTTALGSRARFTTPLLDASHCDEVCTVATVRGGVLYIRHYNGGLQYAEAMKVACNDDTLYYILECRRAVAAPEQAPLYLHADKECAKLLKRYTRRVICE